jgi:hypothetical protein
VDALKKDGIWSLTRLSLKVEGSGAVIDLLRGTRADDEYLPGRTAGTRKQGRRKDTIRTGGAKNTASIVRLHQSADA